MALVDRCIFLPTAGGLSDFTVSAAVTGYLTPAQASAVNGVVYSYAAELKDGSGNITAWEVGQGAYTSGTTTLARTTIIFSSSANAKVNFASAPNVMLSILAEDLNIASGATAISGGSAGSVIFVNSSGNIAQNSADFVWDNTALSLSVGGTTSGAIYAYNTFTSGTSYERGVFSWDITSNTLVIGTDQGSGGGTGRTLQFRVAGLDIANFDAATGSLLWNSDDTYNIGSNGHAPSNVYIATRLFVGGAGNAVIDNLARVFLFGQTSGIKTYINFNNSGGSGDFGSLGFGGAADLWYLGSSNNGADGTSQSAFWNATGGFFTTSATFIARSKTTLTNSAGSSAGTLTNAPAIGNPTKWIGIDDNGTTRQIPAW